MGGDEGGDGGGSYSCCALLFFLQLVCPPECVQSWSVTPCEFENAIQCPNATPPPAPDYYSFGSIGAESNEWARGLCPAGLVSVGGKSGLKVTAASTVRGSASLLLIPSILGRST